MLVTVGKRTAVSEGGLAAYEVGGKQVAIANVGGTLYAFDDTCTHRGCSLADGDLEGATVVCSCHGSEFDVTTGAVLGGPAQLPVRVYPVRLEGDELQVEL